MQSYSQLGNEGSVATRNEQTDERAAEGCPECDGSVRTDGYEAFCADCGLVVRTDALSETFSPGAHGPTRRNGPQEWAVEPTTAFRVNRGLGTRFTLGTDGRGRPLTSAQKRRFGQLRRLDKRMDKRDIRLNEGLRDVQHIGGNLGLPRYVCEDAGVLIRQASERRLPGGRMAWESLAAGAVMLAARRAGVPREPRTVATYAKSTHERACAGARKIRVECNLTDAFPPVRVAAVDAVLAELDELDAQTLLEFARLGRSLLAIADATPIGPGTSRVTVAAAAVYAADRLTDGKTVTQAQVAAAATEVCATSQSTVARYSRELYDAYEAKHGRAELETVIATGTAQTPAR